MNVVIIGLGYVGLPLAQEAVRVGLNVTGLDIRQSTVDGLNAGRSHVDDLSDADIAAMVAGGFRATTDAAGLSRLPDVTVICVPTPLSESDGPDLTAVSAAQVAPRRRRFIARSASCCYQEAAARPAVPVCRWAGSRGCCRIGWPGDAGVPCSRVSRQGVR